MQDKMDLFHFYQRHKHPLYDFPCMLVWFLWRYLVHHCMHVKLFFLRVEIVQQKPLFSLTRAPVQAGGFTP